MNVMITCAGRRHYLVEYIKNFVGAGIVVGVDMSSNAPALAACDKAYITPAVSDEAYVDVLIEICKAEKIDFVFSVSDLELMRLAGERSRFLEVAGSVLVVSAPDVIAICGDKYKTYQFAVACGIPSPCTYISLDQVKDAIKQRAISYPLIVKPRWGSASIGLFVVNDEVELEKGFSLCREAIAQSLLANLCDLSDSVIVQQYLKGQEYGVDVLNSLSGDFIGFAAKKKLAMRSGETDKATTVSPIPFSEAVEKISFGLKHIGNLDCDFIEMDGVYYLIEMNARFGGGYPFTHESGANHIALLLGSSGFSKPYSYAIGRTFSKCDHLVDLSDLKISYL